MPVTALSLALGAALLHALWIRESSIVIATALAGLTLRETVPRRRLAGAAVVVAGIALLAAT